MSNGKNGLTKKLLPRKLKKPRFFPPETNFRTIFFTSDSICDLNKISPNLILVVRSHQIFKRSHYFREIDFTKKILFI